jgi:hypothetical protein
MLDRIKFRVFLVCFAPVLPLYWLWIAVRELWKEEPLHEVYRDWWKALKKGEKL